MEILDGAAVQVGHSDCTTNEHLAMSTSHAALDTTNYPRLQPNGENYTIWRRAWIIAFKSTKTWEIVSGTTARPSSESKSWIELNSKAHAIIISSVHPDIAYLALRATDAAEAWQTLAQRFDRDGNTIVELVRNLSSVRMEEGGDLRAHIFGFHREWKVLQDRATTSHQALAQKLQLTFSSDHLKATFFLASLPPSMDLTVDQLQARGLTTFSSIKSAMLDAVYPATSQEGENLGTHSTRVAGDEEIFNFNFRCPAPNDSHVARPVSAGSLFRGVPLECSWCRKYDHPYVGHNYKFCGRLAKFRYMQRMKRRPAAHRTTQNPYIQFSNGMQISSNEGGIDDIPKYIKSSQSPVLASIDYPPKVQNISTSSCGILATS